MWTRMRSGSHLHPARRERGERDVDGIKTGSETTSGTENGIGRETGRGSENAAVIPQTPTRIAHQVDAASRSIVRGSNTSGNASESERAGTAGRRITTTRTGIASMARMTAIIGGKMIGTVSAPGAGGTGIANGIETGTETENRVGISHGLM